MALFRWTDQLYLIAFNESTQESNANYVISREQGELILATARANGWNPMGTTLGFEFHCELEASQYEDLDQQEEHKEGIPRFPSFALSCMARAAYVVYEVAAD